MLPGGMGTRSCFSQQDMCSIFFNIFRMKRRLTTPLTSVEGPLISLPDNNLLGNRGEIMGVLIFEGMKVGILDGDFTIGIEETGNLNSNLILSTSYNMLPVWLRIAHENINLSGEAKKNIKENWDEDASNQKELLVKELTPSIQVFVSCGIALDSLYDQLRPYANITREDINKWKEKRTKRSAQICEVIKRVYKLNNQSSKAYRENINSIIDFRDKAVHPDNSIKRACTRPDIPVGIDWRFSAYRYDNAIICYQRTMEMILYLYEKKSGIPQVDQEMENIIKALIELNLVTKIAQPDIPADPEPAPVR